MMYPIKFNGACTAILLGIFRKKTALKLLQKYLRISNYYLIWLIIGKIYER